MKVGLLLPQGYFNEFEGWRPGDAWARILEIARLGERLVSTRCGRASTSSRSGIRKARPSTA